MTEAASPERLLFASTTQSFLEKEASLGRPRELHGAGIAFEQNGGAAPPSSAGRACWCPKNSAAAACRAMASQTSHWSPSWPARPSPQDRCIRSAPYWPGWSRRPKTTRTQSNRWFRVRSSASWAVYEPGKPWAPLDAAVTATPTGPVSASTVSRIVSRRAPKARSVGGGASARAPCASSWCRRTRPACVSSRSGRSTW